MSRNEKEAIEKATADAFLVLYNIKMGSSFFVVEYSDSPDVRCKDTRGNYLNFEITMTEDNKRDISALLGRSEHKSLEVMKENLAISKSGKAGSISMSSSLSSNVAPMAICRIKAKLKKNYGANTALVVRDTSPVGWDWDMVANEIKCALDLRRNPFDKGIWIVSYSKDRLFQIA